MGVGTQPRPYQRSTRQAPRRWSTQAMLAGPMAETDCSRVLRKKYSQPLQPRTEHSHIRRGVHTQDNMAALRLDISEGRKMRTERCS